VNPTGAWRARRFVAVCNMSPAEGAWEEWLAASLTELSIDADVFGPYVTGLMVRAGESKQGISSP